MQQYSHFSAIIIHTPNSESTAEYYIIVIDALNLQHSSHIVNLTKFSFPFLACQQKNIVRENGMRKNNCCNI